MKINFDQVSSEPPPPALPDPFRRPTIELSEVKREWQWVHPENIKRFDTVPDIGRIEEVVVSEYENGLTMDMKRSVTITGPNGTKEFDPQVKIWAFTRKQD